MKAVALVGNPNCGKTTLFNVLTGAKQRVGNWSGVTVETQSGYFSYQNKQIEIVDLPGTYTLTNVVPDCPHDEVVTSDFLKSASCHGVVNVVDAFNLERNLYLTLQLLEQHYPVVIALNRMDLAQKAGVQINLDKLGAGLGCQIIPLVARKGKGIELLKSALTADITKADLIISYPAVIETQLKLLSDVTKVPRHRLISWLEGEPCDSVFSSYISQAQQQIVAESGQAADMLIASSRYQLIEDILAKSIKRCKIHTLDSSDPNHLLDRVVCHRYFGIPIFLAVMYALFYFAINIGGAFQDFFELSSDALFVEGLSFILYKANVPDWLTALLVSGLGKGISTVLTFIPVIGAMFFALAFLEDCGYMARAAFVIDRLMRAIGLPGKSFVPMIVGFGCNVPAIMGMRTLENKRDRILAVMMSPFMSCGARLAIFTAFVAAFFPQGGQNIVFLLYIIGIVMALMTGLILKKTLLKGEVAPLLLEMPNYQWPHFQSLWFHCWHRLRRFVFNAGKLILPVCILMGVLNNISVEGKWLKESNGSSILSAAGQMIVPLFKPLGVEQENWPAAVGLLTGILAKEVVIGTLNSLYAKEPIPEQQAPTFDLIARLNEAFLSIGANFAALVQPDDMTSPLNHHVYGEMVKRFNSQANAFAYLLFVLLYFPCVSATAAMVREVKKGWTVFSVCWTTGLAYAIAVLYYQCATFSQHPLQSCIWIAILCFVGAFVLWGIKRYGKVVMIRTLPTPIVLKPV
ncbi:MAG: Fe(2+) transporter permease subunit FeoB [Proteobacteria bacterium]|nr:Fe(2+) transporter permease subunit FeoB [Pseudomonadota bacterium]